MTKYVIGLLGLALMLGSRPLVAGEGGCCGAPGCQACSTCNAGGGCCERGGCCEKAACCPHCGCCLVPQCHTYCEPKTTTVHKHGCVCKEICIPGVSRCGEGCGDSERCGHCGCNSCNSCKTCCNNFLRPVRPTPAAAPTLPTRAHRPRPARRSTICKPASTIC